MCLTSSPPPEFNSFKLNPNSNLNSKTFKRTPMLTGSPATSEVFDIFAASSIQFIHIQIQNINYTSDADSESDKRVKCLMSSPPPQLNSIHSNSNSNSKTLTIPPMPTVSPTISDELVVAAAA
jgi:hypothetical protein